MMAALVLLMEALADATKLMGVAQKTCLPGQRIGVVVVDAGSPMALDEFGKLGIDEAWDLRGGDSATQADFLASLIRECRPQLVLGSHVAGSAELLAQTAAILQCSYAPGCIRLERTAEDSFVLGRPCLQGRAYAEMAFSGDGPIIVAVDPVAFWPAREGPGRPVEVHHVQLCEPTSRRKVLEVILGDPAQLDLSDADLILAGGAGMGSREAFETLAELASALEGALGASRVAVDRGWATRDRQIGQTGRSVSPRVYVAWGISGATQHLAGVRSWERLIAVNNDPDAPIFRFADVQVLADAPSLAKVMLDALATRQTARQESEVGR
ncbi:MAG: electron transfer flavoprotein subunit alpha/FixB family protein [Thermoflexaceae bacterium]|nr:electron transfer flavoprotein subunit alpha/FixB family protein [Thermoflexaceae bacterium]